MTSQYHHDYRAFGRIVLNGPEMVALMLERAEKVKARAEATAPDATPFGEGYKYSFSVSAGTHGGRDNDRAYGRVSSSDPYAHIIEFGSAEQIDRKGRKHGATPEHRTLGKALGAANE